MASADSENGSFELSLLRFVDDSIVDSEDALILIGLAQISLLVGGADAGSS